MENNNPDTNSTNQPESTGPQPPEPQNTQPYFEQPVPPQPQRQPGQPAQHIFNPQPQPQQQSVPGQPPVQQSMQQPQQAYQQPQAQTHQTDTLGIISIIMAFVAPLIGLIIGILGKNKAKKEGYSAKLSSIGVVISATFMIITILGFIAVFALSAANSGNVQSRASDTIAKNNVNYIYLKLEEYYNLNKSYPNSLDPSNFSSGEASIILPIAADSRYQYEPTGCTGNMCSKYTLTYELELEDSPGKNTYQKQSLN